MVLFVGGVFPILYCVVCRHGVSLSCIFRFWCFGCFCLRAWPYNRVKVDGVYASPSILYSSLNGTGGNTGPIVDGGGGGGGGVVAVPGLSRYGVVGSGTYDPVFFLRFFCAGMYFLLRVVVVKLFDVVLWFFCSFRLWAVSIWMGPPLCAAVLYTVVFRRPCD